MTLSTEEIAKKCPLHGRTIDGICDKLAGHQGPCVAASFTPLGWAPGSRIRFTGVFLKATGQIAGGEGGKIFTAVACSCSLCKLGRFVATGESSNTCLCEHDFDQHLQDGAEKCTECTCKGFQPRPRHINISNVCGEHELTIRNDP